MTAFEKGALEFAGLEPVEYSVCFADDEGRGESCADVTVGKDGAIRGETVFDKKRQAANAEYQGHVTLLR